MTDAPQLSRRDVLSGRVASAVGSDAIHISSAVVFTRPELSDLVAHRLADNFGVEIHAKQGAKLVIVMEAKTAGGLGELLNRIALTEGVITANMVYEQLDPGDGT
jgi:nitrate reductase NapD